MEHVSFEFDNRLGIAVPQFVKPWEKLPYNQQIKVMLHWEKERGKIPDRISELEKEINVLQDLLYEESHFDTSCELNSNISNLASTINDLWLWYRAGENVEVRAHH